MLAMPITFILLIVITHKVSLLGSIYVTEFAKRDLPFTSSLPTLAILNLGGSEDQHGLTDNENFRFVCTLNLN